jgi:chorismate synthase
VAHDVIRYEEGTGYVRPTERAGGIEGGISNGGLLVARVAMKPLATLNRPVLETVDVVTKESTLSFRERTDVTAVPAMGVVAETMMALVLASEVMRKFGGDSLAEVVRNRDGFVAALGSTPSAAVGRHAARAAE